jgi:hypothetical protein
MKFASTFNIYTYTVTLVKLVKNDFFVLYAPAF